MCLNTHKIYQQFINFRVTLVLSRIVENSSKQYSFLKTFKNINRSYMLRI